MKQQLCAQHVVASQAEQTSLTGCLHSKMRDKSQRKTNKGNLLGTGEIPGTAQLCAGFKSFTVTITSHPQQQTHTDTDI